MIATSFKLKNEQKASGIDMEMSDAETAIEGLTEKKMQLNQWIEMAHRGSGIENIKTKRMWKTGHGKDGAEGYNEKVN